MTTLDVNANQKIAMTAARNSIIINVLLSAFKLFAGIVGQSAAMISDAVHSITDLISTVIVIIGIRLAGQEADKQHPYGHERFECVATLVLSALVLVVGIGIGWTGVQTIIAGDFYYVAVPGLVALVAAVVAVVVKEALFWYVRSKARKIDSSALMADAWHSRADGLSSIGSFIGILGARMGLPIMDSIAAIIICLFILRTAIGIALDAIGKMTDKAASDEIENEMRSLILEQESVKGIDQLRTRLFGNRIYVDVEICLDPTMTLEQAHEVAQKVHDAIEDKFPKVKHCMVHVNPFILPSLSASESNA